MKGPQGWREYNTPLRPDEIEEIRVHDKKAGPMLHANLATAALWQRRALLEHCDAVHLLLVRCLPYIERGYSGVAGELVKEINSVLVGPAPEMVGGEKSKDGPRGSGAKAGGGVGR